MNHIIATNASGIHVRLARTPEEISFAQRLRYKVFYEEWGAVPDAAMAAERREVEAFDDIMDHLIVVDPRREDDSGGVVGNYRLLRGDTAAKHGKFYTSQEFDIAPIVRSGANLLELGRSCVLAEYRTMPVLQLLWQGIAAYVAEHNIELMFGCASFHGTDPERLREQLSYLYHYHLADETMRPHVVARERVNMNMMAKEDIDVRQAQRGLEPLIKGYLRLGATVGEGAFIDRQFNSIDVCIMMPTQLIADRYIRHYERAIQRPIVSGMAAAVDETHHMPALVPA